MSRILTGLWKLRSSLFVLLLCFILLVLFYLPALNAPYFSLDDAALFSAPHLQPPVTIRSITTLFGIDSNLDYYPIRDLSYLVDSFFWPHSLVGARIHQIFLFCLSMYTVLLLLLELGIPFRFASISVSAWAIHPIHSETVLWLSARKDLLALLFGLMNLFSWIKLLKTGRASWAMLSCISFILSVFSKASFVLLPWAYALSFGFQVYLNSNGSAREKARPWREKRVKYTLLILLIISTASSLFQNWFYTHVTPMIMEIPLLERIQSSSIALGKCLIGIVLFSQNIIDTDNFGEWTKLNSNFLLLGILGWVSILSIGIHSIIQKNYRTFTLTSLIVVLYLPTSGLLFPHRYFYSTRYFEPVAIILVTGMIATLYKRIPNLVLYLLFIPLILGAVAEGRIWSHPVHIREKALRAQPRSISLKTYLLGELASHPNESLDVEPNNTSADQDLTKTKLIEDLTRRCEPQFDKVDKVKSVPINCQTYHRYAYILHSSHGSSEKAQYHLQHFIASASQMKPTPMIVSRLNLENQLIQGEPDPKMLLNWIREHRYYPLPEYRILKLTSECLLLNYDKKEGNLTQASIRDEYQKYLIKRLLTPQYVSDFLRTKLHPSLRLPLSTCLL